MATGSCDVCEKQNVKISRSDVYGIETYACSVCRGDEPRRCETNICELGGECMSCGADNGEACQDRCLGTP
jgi:hypothetical protein